MASSGLCHFLVVVSTRLNHFQGWPGRESVFFLDSGTIWGWQKRWVTLYVPDMSHICLRYVPGMSKICLHPRERWDDFDCSRDQSNISLCQMFHPNYQTTNHPRKYRAPSIFSYLLIDWEILSIWNLAT